MRQLLTLLLLLSFGFSQAQRTKKALIIAVGDYAPETRWGKISSDKDVPLITTALKHHGFEEENILIIQDTQATKDGILQAFAKIQRDLHEGDILVIHYSGHGQQVYDVNGDEIDYRDESLVPINAPARYEQGVYEGENHLIDDELDSIVYGLRSTLGKKGSLTMIFDACHSGTATRGIAPARGTDEVMGPKDKIRNDVPKETTTYEIKTPKSRGADGEENLATFVLFSGASAEELNYETKDEEGNFVGSLSYGISKMLLKADNKTTYSELFDQLKTEMAVIAPKQSPQVEGDIESPIFGGEASPKLTFYKVKQSIDKKTFILNAGQLMGVYNGSKVALYPPNTKDLKKAKAIATGTVSNCTLLDCDLLLDADVDKETARTAWVFITEQNFADIRVKVKLDLPDNAGLSSAIKNEIEQFKSIISLTDKNPDLIIEANNKFTRGNKLQIISSNENVIYQNPIESNDNLFAQEVTKNILSFAQAQFVRGLDLKDQELDVSFEIIPITEVKDTAIGTGRYKRTYTQEVARGNIMDKVQGGVLHMKVGDHFKIKLTNNGSEVAYFTLIDVEPVNNINVLIPGKGLPPAEFKIRPGETIELDKIYKIYPPLGMETFKLICTKEPIDLRGVVQTKGKKTRANRLPFEQLMASTYVENTRGAGQANEDVTLPSGSVNIFNLVFKIEE